MKTLARSALLLIVCAGLAHAGDKSLDGKTFVGTITEKGKAKAENDTFVFKDGKFRATGCDTYGFADAAYTSKAADGGTLFEVETVSPKEGKMKWKGVARGDVVEGGVVWTKAGQKDIEYTFKGSLKK
jgi:hypothetical protein